MGQIFIKEYCTRLQIRKFGKRRDRKIWETLLEEEDHAGWDTWREGERRAIRVMDWSTEGKRRRGRPRKNWQETMREDIRCMNMTWGEAINLAEGSEGWSDCVARCAEMQGKD